ncbi:MAG TPA: ATP12 family protein [Rhizomicrobium sp.]|nr:ATP12 family protein [Rhizomicrobium sp.]
MKRFYKEVSVGVAEDGFRILLDGRPVKTPAKNMLALPTRALAETIAAEWAGQGETVDPLSMPFLRLADTVIDGVVANRAEVIGAILRFGENDLLCYRAHQPPDLARLQREGWDPVLDWARRRYGVEFVVVEGFGHQDQPATTLAAFRAALEQQDAFSLAALHVVASIAGSVVLALALADGELVQAQVFVLSRIDEEYQASKWGRDHEAEVRATNLARELDKAAAFILAART